MGEERVAQERRPVLIHTLVGSIEGSLTVNPFVRTLDYLNLAQRFLPLECEAIEGLPSFGPGRIGVNKELVLFIAELTDDAPGAPRAEALHFSRRAVGLRLADCEIEGYMHLRGIQDPIALLNHHPHEFVALTSASVVGPNLELASTFLAINPAFVTTVRVQHPTSASTPIRAAGAVSGVAFDEGSGG